MSLQKLISLAWLPVMSIGKSWISSTQLKHLFQTGQTRLQQWLYITKLPSKTWLTRISLTKTFLEIAVAMQQLGLEVISTRCANNIFLVMTVTYQVSFQRMFMLNLLQSALKQRLAKECPRDTKLRQRFALCQLNAPNILTKIIVASVRLTL